MSVRARSCLAWRAAGGPKRPAKVASPGLLLARQETIASKRQVSEAVTLLRGAGQLGRRREGERGGRARQPPAPFLSEGKARAQRAGPFTQALTRPPDSFDMSLNRSPTDPVEQVLLP